MINYWSFSIKHPVDVTIACLYIDKHFPDRIGNAPAPCWSWLGKTAEQQIHYSDRTPTCRIVFDTTNKCWLLSSNITRDVLYTLEKLFDRSIDWTNVARRSGKISKMPLGDVYEDHMQLAHSECTLPSYMIDVLRRTADVELREHNQEACEYRKRQKQLSEQYEDSRKRNFQGDLLPYHKKYG